METKGSVLLEREDTAETFFSDSVRLVGSDSENEYEPSVATKGEEVEDEEREKSFGGVPSFSEEGQSLLEKVNEDIQHVRSGYSDFSALPYNETEGDFDDSFSDKSLPDGMRECEICKVLISGNAAYIDHLQSQHTQPANLHTPPPKYSDSEGREGQDQAVDESFEELETKDGQTEKRSIGTAPNKKRRNTIRRRRSINHHVSCLHPGCGKVFQTVGALKTHSVCHEIMKECIHCGVAFGTATAVLRHIDRRHNPKNIVQLPCTYPNCNEVFRHQTVLDKHLARHARVDKTCSHCNQTFKLKRQLNEHIKQVHATDADSLQLMCQNCGIPMADRESLLKHMSTICFLSDGIVCEFDGCGEMFYSRQSLQNHRRRHFTGENETNPSPSWHYCPSPACGQRFLAKKKLKIHLRITQHDIQVEDMPFVCLFRSCGLRFPSKTDVIAHMKSFHWGNRKKEAAALKKKQVPAKVIPRPVAVDDDIKCPACKQRFSSDAMMRYHIKTNHAIDLKNAATSSSSGGEIEKDGEEDRGGEGEDDKQVYVFNLEMFRCPLCHTSYHALGRLRQHIENLHHEMGQRMMELLHKIDTDTSGSYFKDIVKTTLPRDCQVNKPRGARSKKIKNSKAKFLGEKVRDAGSSSVKNKSSHVGNDETDGTGTDSHTELSGDEDEDPDGLNDSCLDEEGSVSMDPSSTSSCKNKSRLKRTRMCVCRFPSCNKLFTNKIDLTKHQKTHTRNLKCPHEGCQAEFFSMINLRGHIKLVHGSTDVYTCDQCGRVGKGTCFKKHMKTCSSSTMFVCEECGKAFSKKSSYKNHLGVHKEKPTVMKPCTYEGCSKMFKSKQDLDRHVNVHTGERPHKCPYGGCNKTYKQRPHLLVHLKTHSVNKDGERETYPCQYCGFPFKHKHGRNKHVKNSCVLGPNKEVILEKMAKKKQKESQNSKRSSDVEVEDEPDCVRTELECVKTEPDCVKTEPDCLNTEPDCLNTEPDCVKTEPPE